MASYMSKIYSSLKLNQLKLINRVIIDQPIKLLLKVNFDDS